MSPLTLGFALVVLLAMVAFVAYGSGFHRGHVDGFHDGFDVARDDLKERDAYFHRWNTRCKKPHFPCELLISIEYEPGKWELRLQKFEDEAQWGEYNTLVDEPMLWYDVVRIAPRES